MTEAFKDDKQVAFIAVQTVFEGYQTNTQGKLRKNQVTYDVKVPMAHAAGDPESHDIPEIMKQYRSGGTPWTVIIDPSGTVAYNGFHIETDEAVELIKRLANNAN